MPVPRLRLCEFGIFEAARGGPSMAISLLQTLGMARCGRTLVPGNGPANAYVRPAAQGALSAQGHSRRFDAQLFGPGLFSFVAACGRTVGGHDCFMPHQVCGATPSIWDRA